MKKLILLFCLLTFHQAQAKIKAPKTFDELTLKIALHALADPFNPCIQIALEYKPRWQVGYQIEIANRAGLEYFHTNKSNIRYGKYKVSERWYYYEKQKLNMYAGVDVFYMLKSYNISNDTYSDNMNYYSFKDALVQKATFGFFLMDGITLKHGKHLRLDLDVNAGIRYTRISYANLEGLQISQQPKDIIFYDNQENVEGKHFYPHLGLGIRLGYVIQTTIVKR